MKSRIFNYFLLIILIAGFLFNCDISQSGSVNPAEENQLYENPNLMAADYLAEVDSFISEINQDSAESLSPEALDFIYNFYDYTYTTPNDKAARNPQDNLNIRIKLVPLKELNEKYGICENSENFIQVESCAEAVEMLEKYLPDTIQSNDSGTRGYGYLTDSTQGYSIVGIKLWDYSMNSYYESSGGKQTLLRRNVTGSTFIWRAIQESEDSSSNGATTAFHTVRYRFEYFIGIAPVGMVIQTATRTLSDSARL